MPIRQDRELHLRGGEVQQFTRRHTFTAGPPHHAGCFPAPATSPPAKAATCHRTSERRPHPVPTGLRRATSAPTFTRREVVPLRENVRTAHNGTWTVTPSLTCSLESNARARGAQLVTEALRLAALCVETGNKSAHAQANAVTSEVMDTVTLQRLERVRLPCLSDVSEKHDTNTRVCTLLHASMLMTCSLAAFSATVCDTEQLSVLWGPFTGTRPAAYIKQTFNGGAQALVHVKPRDEAAATAMPVDAVLFTAVDVYDYCSSTSTPLIAAAMSSFREAERHRRGAAIVADAAQTLLVCAARAVEDDGVPTQHHGDRLAPRHVSWIASADGAPPTQCTRVHCVVAYPENVTDLDMKAAGVHLMQALSRMAEAGRAQRTCTLPHQEAGATQHHETAVGGLSIPHFGCTRNSSPHGAKPLPTHPLRSSTPAPSSLMRYPASTELCEGRAAQRSTLAEHLCRVAGTPLLDEPQARTRSTERHGAACCFRSHADARPAPALRHQSRRLRRAVSAVVLPLADRRRAPEHLPTFPATTPGTSFSSPEPSVPRTCQSVRSVPNLSPICRGTHETTTDKDDGASLRTYEQTGAAPSILSSLRLTRLVSNRDVSEREHCGARASHPPCSDDRLPRSTSPRISPAPSRSRQLHPNDVVAHVSRSARRCGDAAEALMPTLPLQKRSEQSVRTGADDVVSAPHIRLWVHGVCGLPREAFRVRSRAVEAAPATEVWVYVQSNLGDRRRRKTPCVAYADAVTFPAVELVFSGACGRSDGAAEDHQHVHKDDTQQILTLTVAVHLSTGSQVKLGVSYVGLRNLQDGVATPMCVPVVAKAGTPRARARGEVSLTLMAEGFGGGEGDAPVVKEATVRRAVQDALRHGYREELHRAEVIVRQHCRDSLSQLHHAVAQLRRGESPCMPSSAEHDGAVRPKEEKEDGGLDAFAASSQRSNSPFTSLVLDAPSRAHRSASCTAASARVHVAQSVPAGTVGGARVQKAAHGGGKRGAVRCSLYSLLSAQSSLVSGAVVAPLVCKATSATMVHTRKVAVTPHAVRNLLDVFGLPLQSCASLFLRLHVLPSRGADKTPRDFSVLDVDGEGARTTTAVLYDGQNAAFEDAVVRFTLPVNGDGFSICCTAYSGVPACWEELGVCHVHGAWPSSDSPYRVQDEAAAFKLVRCHGSLDARVCGELVMTVSSCDANRFVGTSADPLASTCAARLQRHVLAWLWRCGRRQLHRLDAIAQEAVAGTKGAHALAKCLELPTKARMSDVNVVAPEFSLIIELTVLDGQTFPAAAEPEGVPHGRVLVAWSCGAFAGRSAPAEVRPCGPAGALSARFGEVLRLPETTLRDGEELCVVVYGLNQRATAPIDARELCRTHLDSRSVRTCRAADPRAPAAVVQLPLVWHAGERGAYERGFVQLRIESPPCRVGQRSPAPWMGFSAQWPPRVALRKLLSCYSTERLHRLLCLLAFADPVVHGEGDDDGEAAMRMVHELELAWGSVSGGVCLRVELLGFRPQPEAAATRSLFHGRDVYVKVYHRGKAALRTPPLRCADSAPDAGWYPSLSLPEFEGRTDVVPLLDKDTHLLHITTTAPHHERLVLEVGVERAPQRRSSAVACAEMSLATFVSPADTSTHSDGTGTLTRRYCWLPLQDHLHETVAEVGVRVDWADPAAAPAPATSSAAVAPAAPLGNTTAAQDVLSLLRTYQPASVYRWSWYLGRFPDPAVALRQLRQEVLQSAVVAATVYVDVAGVSPRTTVTARCEWAALARGRQALYVSASYLGCRSPLSCLCQRLPESAARATVEAARLLGSGTHAGDVQSGGLCMPWRHSLRLDLKLPTPTIAADASVADDLCLKFTTPYRISKPAARATSATPRPRHNDRSSSADPARQLRSRSAFARSSLASCRFDAVTVSDQRAALPATPVEVGEVRLSLKALCTVPELYRKDELIVVPLVVCSGVGGGGGGDRVVLGDVYLRVRMAAHDPVPSWLRYTAAEVSAALRGGSLEPHDLHVELRRQQHQCERRVSARAHHLATLHATFFRECTTVPTTPPLPTVVPMEEPPAAATAQYRGQTPLPFIREKSTPEGAVAFFSR